MKIGIVWLPNVGKSTLFNALTKNYSANSENFPFCTIEPNVGIVNVEDERVDKLSEISNSKETVYSNIEFVDIAGIVRGASKWEWLGNQFLANIREVDAIVQVVRHFEDTDVVHVDGGVDPMRDIETINYELILADLEQVESKLSNLQKKYKAKEKEAMKIYPVLEKIRDLLYQDKLAYDVVDELDEEEQKILKQYNLLTFKPFIYAFNVSEQELCKSEQIKSEYEEKLWKPVQAVSAKLESEMIDLDEEEKQDFVNDIKENCEDKNAYIPTLNDLIKLAFDEVGLMYFFTTWEKESKAWTVKKNSTAPQAAWAIHTDFEKWFIKAEVATYDDFVKYGWWQKCRDNWVARLEWKDYIVQDGDVILFRFNV